MTEAAETPADRRVSLFHLALLLPWIALVVDASRPIVDNSFLWHVQAGSLQAKSGSVLTEDPFSLTLSGEPWITQSWLAELVYAWAEGMFGFGYVAPMMLIASSLTVVGLGLLAYRRSASVAATAITVVLSAILLPRFLVPRPALFSYPLMVAVMLAWERKSARWALPFIFWIWASVHASFAIGLAYIVLSVMAKREWKAVGTVVAAGVPTLLTAHGLGVVGMLVDFGRARPYLALITEWRTPDFLEFALLPVIVGLMFMMYGATKGRLNPNQLWIIAPFVILTMSATRAVAIGWLVLAPFVAEAMSGLEFRRLKGYPPKLAAAAAVLVIVIPLPFADRAALDEDRFPLAAVSHLAPGIPTFHDDVVGGYLIWEDTLETGVFIDDRVELYQGRIQEFVDVRAGRLEWEPVFERDGIRQAILRVDEPLISDLERSGWSTVGEDASFVVMVRP